MQEHKKYLTFTFFQKHQGDVTFVGRTDVMPPEPNSSPEILGIISIWGHEIPVMSNIYFRNACELTENSCIIIFEYLKPDRYFLATVVSEVANVMNIAGKNLENHNPADLSEVETQYTQTKFSAMAGS